MQSCMHQRHASKTCNAFCLIQVQVITLSLFSVTRDNNKKPAPRYNLQKQRIHQWVNKTPSGGKRLHQMLFMWDLLYLCTPLFIYSFIYILIYFTYYTAKVLFVCLESTHVTIIRKIDKAMIFFSLYIHILWKIDWLCYKNK